MVATGKTLRDKLKKRGSGVDLKKYRTIIISVVLFLVFDLTILGLNYYYSFRVQQSAVEINLAARQTNLIQQIAKTLSDINLLAERDFSNGREVNVVGLKQETYRQFDELKQARDLFDDTLKAFDVGGEVTGVENNPVKVNAIDILSAQNNVEQTKNLWEPFLGLIDNFANGYQRNNLLLDNIQFAADYARIYNTRLSTEMGQLTTALEQRSQQQANIVRLVQIVGIVAALAIFLFIVFRALRQLLRTDAELAEARQETTQIMATVNEGLFLIDRELTVGNEYSAQLEKIIGQKSIGGKRLPEVLEQMVSEETLKVVKTFVKQLYNKRVVEDLVMDLNPLQQITVLVNDENNNKITRYLDFRFSRVYQGEEIERALVSVSDVTEAVKLEERLAQEREQNEEQMQMLSTVLNADRNLMSGFVRSSKQRIIEINNILKESDRSQEAMEDKVRRIYREAHSLKGEASALKLRSYVTLCESFEDKIKVLQNKTNLSGNDFLSLTMSLDEIMGLSGLIETLNSRISESIVGFGKDDKSVQPELAKEENLQSDDEFEELVIIDASEHQVSDESIKKYYANFAADIAERNRKSVTLSCNGMSDARLDERQRELVKEISVQFLRNAIVHGIETPAERRTAGKAETGQVQLLLVRNDQHSADLIVEDDGGGIDFDKIREKARQSGRYSAEEIATWDEKQIFGLIFNSGFSTAEHAGEDAGRGVGLDIVKDRIRKLNGKLKVASSPGQYTRFTINFPLH
ncbi:MAG: ATP-binding protein [Neisseria sp.]|nr:ATP-binding protein [Neisseria sp.]